MKKFSNHWLLEISKYSEVNNINKLCLNRIILFFQQNGLFETTEKKYSAKKIAEVFGQNKEVFRRINVLLDLLLHNNIINQEKSGFSLIESPEYQQQAEPFLNQEIFDICSEIIDSNLDKLKTGADFLPLDKIHADKISSKLNISNEMMEKVVLFTVQVNIEKAQKPNLSIFCYGNFSLSFFAELDILCEKYNVKCKFYYDAETENIGNTKFQNLEIIEQRFLADTTKNNEIKHSIDIFISKHLLFDYSNVNVLISSLKNYLKPSGVIISEEAFGLSPFHAITLPLDSIENGMKDDRNVFYSRDWEALLLPNSFIDINKFNITSSNELPVNICMAQNNESTVIESAIENIPTKTTNNEVPETKGNQSQKVDILELTNEIKTVLATMLEIPIDQLDMGNDLIELGMDSILAGELGAKISEKYNIKINPAIFFTINTGEKLVEVLYNDFLGAATTEECAVEVPQNEISEKVTTIQKGLIADDVREILAHLLEVPISEMDMTGDLVELGMDSILASELGAKVSEKYDIKLNPALFFTVNTGEKLVEALKDEYKIVDSSCLDVEPSEQKTNNEVPVKSITPQAESDNVNYKPIAIIGCSGKFPQSNNVTEFWNHFYNGEEALSDLPVERWKNSEFKNVKIGNKSATIKAGIMPNADSFDNAFFNISKQEALVIDPKQKLLLESVWHAIEDAGYKASELKESKTGVFVGFENNEYAEISQKVNQGYGAENATCMLANRISYFFDFKGNSVVTDAACASSLSAMHYAIQSLHLKENKIAVVSGVSVLYSPSPIKKGIESGWISPDGKCKPFDEFSTGWLVGESVASVILKPLDEAIRDNDNIYGIVKGSAISHCGKTNAIGVPNPKSIGENAKEAMYKAGVTYDQISYVETHGLGIKLIDAAEIEGLRGAFTGNNTKPTYIGSVTANYGNLEPVSGLAGVIKLLLSLKNKVIPKNINIDQLSSYINFSGTSFTIPKENVDWNQRAQDTPKLCAINNFGFGGVNCFFILEEAVNTRQEIPTNQESVFLLSAKNKNQLNEYCQKYLEFLGSHSNINMADLLFTLHT